MGSISESMAGMSGGGKRFGGGISGAMSRSPMKEKEPEEHEGGVPEHMKAMHSEMGGGKMVMAHKHEHEEGYTSHQMGEDGKHEGPHDHENMEALKSHMGKFFNEEEHEPSEHDDHDGLM